MTAVVIPESADFNPKGEGLLKAEVFLVCFRDIGSRARERLGPVCRIFAFLGESRKKALLKAVFK